MKFDFITKKQEYIMNIIYNQLGAIMEGEPTRANAKDFISDNINYINFNKAERQYSSYEKIYNFPTERQWFAIRKIEREENVDFTGTTFDDASEFISFYKENRGCSGPVFNSYDDCLISKNDSCDNIWKGAMPNTGISSEARELDEMLTSAIFLSGGVNVFQDYDYDMF